MIIYINQKKKKYRGYYYYILQLEQGKYYVGLTHNVHKRYKRHKEGTGAEWTKIYKPIKILTCKETGSYSYREAGQVEDQITLKFMKRYGRENVRGGKYCAVDQEILNQLMGKELCEKIDGIHNKKTDSNKAISNKTIPNRKTKKKKVVDTTVWSKQMGFGIMDLPFRDYTIKEYGVGKPIRTRNWINTKFLVKGDVVTARVVHDAKTVWVPDQVMKRYGKETVVNRIRQNSSEKDAENYMF